MPTTSRSASKKSTATTAKRETKKAKLEEIDAEAKHEVERAPVATKTRASGNNGPSSSKNLKKRARNTDSDDEEDENDLPTASSPKAKTSSARASSGPKKAASKKVMSAKKGTSKHEDSDESDNESYEPKPSKRSSTAKQTTGTTKKTSKVAEENDSDADNGEEPTLVEIPTDFSTPKLLPGELKIVSWNVASYRAILKKGLLEYLKNEDADIVCLQETKIATEPESTKHGYHAYFFGCKAKPGLHGTGLLSKVKPLKVDMVTTLDEEGRVLVAEYDTFFLINTYVPNSGMKLERLSWRLNWDSGLHNLILDLEKKKPIIWTGDLNVAKHPIDLANPTGNKRTAGFTPQERDSFIAFTEAHNIIDTYRSRNPDEADCYTFWTYKRNSRAKNIGWRMDYFMASASLDASITQSYRRNHILGSDHCPIVIHLRK